MLYELTSGSENLACAFASDNAMFSKKQKKKNQKGRHGKQSYLTAQTLKWEAAQAAARKTLQSRRRTQSTRKRSLKSKMKRSAPWAQRREPNRRQSGRIK